MNKQILTLGMTLALLAPIAAQAEHDRYDQRDRRGGPAWGGQRVVRPQQHPAQRAEVVLIRRATELERDVRRADARHDIDHRTANDLQYRLDRVQRFLHNDRFLDRAEFERRDADLRDIERDFEGALRFHRGHRHDRDGRCLVGQGGFSGGLFQLLIR